MRFLVDKVPKNRYDCIANRRDECALKPTGMCPLFLSPDAECPRLISYDEYIRERNEKCSKEMEERAHDS